MSVGLYSLLRNTTIVEKWSRWPNSQEDNGGNLAGNMVVSYWARLEGDINPTLYNIITIRGVI